MARGTVVIDTNRCKGCELCTTVCPQNVLIMADSFNARGYRPVQLVDPESKCTGCMLCAVMCPDSVLTVYRLPVKARAARQGDEPATTAAVSGPAGQVNQRRSGDQVGRQRRQPVLSDTHPV